MARASQYSRLRRIVMQVTMAILFGVTLGLAALVVNSRERAASVALSDTPREVGALAIHLPKSWAVPQEGQPWPINTMAVEPPNPKSLGQRDLIVCQAKSAEGESSERLLTRYLTQFEGERGEVQPLDILGAPGVIARFERMVIDPENPHGGSLMPGWYAAAVVPGGFPDGIGGDLAVVVSVEGPAADGPAGARLLREVAGAMKLRGN